MSQADASRRGAAARLFALVPCAGSGSRAGAQGPKQYVEIGGAPMVAHTLRALSQVSRLTATLVVLSPDDTLFESRVPQFAGPRSWISRRGGASRAETVANGLDVLLGKGASPDDWVLVHDAARCLLRARWVDALIDACLADGDAAIGGLLASPLADTLKDECDGRVAATVDRRGKWAAQTPQMFRIGMLQGALARCGDGVTDESSAIEALGLAPRLVEAPAENLKVTWPADFALAARLLATRGDET
jgi:2-C-methyl-D-erythritol 4-phosphate cytidylyltransferase